MLPHARNAGIVRLELARKMGIQPGKALYYTMLSQIIERIGDHAVRIAEHALPVMRGELDKKDPCRDQKIERHGP